MVCGADFFLRSTMTPMECRSPQARSMDCANPEVVSTDLMVRELVLEVDSRFTAYSRCNDCENHTDHHGHNNCTNGEYVCACGSSHGGHGGHG